MQSIAKLTLLAFLAIFLWSAVAVIICGLLSIFVAIPGGLVGLLGQGLIVGFFGAVISGAVMEL